MVVPNILQSGKDERRTHNPQALVAVKTIRPKLFRRSSVTSWGKDNLRMTRAAANINLKELMLSVQQQKVRVLSISTVLVVATLIDYRKFPTLLSGVTNPNKVGERCRDTGS